MRKKLKFLVVLLIISALVLSACGGTDTSGGSDSPAVKTKTATTGTAKTKTKTGAAGTAKTKTAAEPAKVYPIDQPAPEAPAEHVLVVKISDKETTLTREDILAIDSVKDYEMETHGKVNGTFQTVYPVMKGISLSDLLASQGYTGGATELYMGGVGSEPSRKPFDILEREKAIIALSRDNSWNDPASKTGTLVFYMEGDMGPSDKVTAEDGTSSKAVINNVNYIEVK